MEAMRAMPDYDPNDISTKTPALDIVYKRAF